MVTNMQLTILERIGGVEPLAPSPSSWTIRIWSKRRVSNPQPSPWKGDALPIELLLQISSFRVSVFETDSSYMFYFLSPFRHHIQPKSIIASINQHICEVVVCVASVSPPVPRQWHTLIPQKNSAITRKERDSNSRCDFSHTPLAEASLKPLGHPSVASLSLDRLAYNQ